MNTISDNLRETMKGIEEFVYGSHEDRREVASDPGSDSNAQPLCANCGHEKHLHEDQYGCEYERGDGYRGAEFMEALGPCGCKEYEPETEDEAPFSTEDTEGRYGN
jgi:hypothetical protein